MKLISCHIDNFGTFHNFDLSFEENLNVFVQENGWGKSTLAVFIRAMLYGYGSTRKKDLAENDRKHYLPWQGGTYGGTLTFEKDGKRYLITRTFGETQRFDKMSLKELESGKSLAIDNVGEWLFKLDSESFKRSAFITQNSLNTDGSSLGIHARLNALLGEASDVGAYDKALKDLSARMKNYEKTGRRGYINELQNKIDTLLAARRNAEEKIRRVEELRQSITGHDREAERIQGEIDSLKKKIEAADSGKKEREAARKLFEDLKAKKQERGQELAKFLAETKDTLPTKEELQTLEDSRLKKKSVEEGLAELRKQQETQEAEILSQYDALLNQETGIEEAIETFLDKEPVPKEAELLTVEQGITERSRVRETMNSLAQENKQKQTKLKEQLETLRDQETALKEEAGKAAAGFGGPVPSSADIQKAKHDVIECETLSAEVKALEIKKSGTEKKMKDQEARYGGKLPTAAALSELPNMEKALREAEEKAKAVTADLEAVKASRASQMETADFETSVPDPEKLGQLQKGLADSLTLEREAAGLESQISGKREELKSLESAARQFDAIEQTTAPSSEAGKPTAAIGCVVLAIVSAILGVLATPALFAGTAVLLIAALVLFTKNRKEAERLAEKNRAFEEEKRLAEEKKAALKARQAELSSSLKETEEEAEKKRKEAEKLLHDALSYLKTWAASVTKETAAEECAGLLAKTEKWKQTEERLLACQNQITAQEKEISCRKEELLEREKLLPSDTSGQPLEQRVEMALADVEEFGRLKTTFQMRSEQAKEQEEKRKHLQDGVRVFLTRFHLSLENAKEELEELEAKALAARNAEQKLAAHKSRIKDFETANQAMLSGEGSEDAGVSRLKKQLLQISAGVDGVLKRYGVSEEKFPEWAVRSRERIASYKDLLQKQKTLTKQREDFEAANQAVLAPKKKKASPDTPAGRFEAQLKSLTETIHAILARYSVADEQVDSWIETSHEKLTVLSDKQKNEAAAANQLLEFEIKNRELLSEKADDENSPLKLELKRLEDARDNVMRERTQAEDGISHADETLQSYRTVLQQLKELGEEKQSAQKSLYILQKSIGFLEKAKENLASRYLGLIESNFNGYLSAWVKDKELRGVIGVDFDITMEQDGKEHEAEGYSSGYMDIIDFCMRMALIDTLFGEERPFIIMDDPFVNLDEEHLEYAMRLLKAMAADSQILYFVCHPMRAKEPEAGAFEAIDRKKLIKAEPRQKKPDLKPKREQYRLVPAPAPEPAAPKKRITNNIFSLEFSANALTGHSEFELFFVDEKEKVICDKQQISVSDGEVFPQKIRFCLNTGNAAGKTYTMMIRNVDAPENEVAKKIAFEAALTFTADFDF